MNIHELLYIRLTLGPRLWIYFCTRRGCLDGTQTCNIGKNQQNDRRSRFESKLGTRGLFICLEHAPPRQDLPQGPCQSLRSQSWAAKTVEVTNSSIHLCTKMHAKESHPSPGPPAVLRYQKRPNNISCVCAPCSHRDPLGLFLFSF